MTNIQRVYINPVINNALTDNLRLYKEAKMKLAGLNKSKKYHFAYVAFTLSIE